ncbi:hypothetical protein [Jidongwangia harbinensis]|uniref:hypothetical protein n=1 Tax=Jidongwangia harbinensis TaxID=2878561 RepID=UPI001CD9AEFE|nr:hypothetical protein [Jidongwangia harbinensis]MCA2216676.1 hypothetical protein [Jidongwangia harbinensis]
MPMNSVLDLSGLDLDDVEIVDDNENQDLGTVGAPNSVSYVNSGANGRNCAGGGGCGLGRPAGGGMCVCH